MTVSASVTETDLRALPHEHGLRWTSQRLSVVLLRTVTTLVDVDVLHRIAFTEKATSYGLATRAHHHALCSRCGQVSDIPTDHPTTRRCQDHGTFPSP